MTRGKPCSCEEMEDMKKKEAQKRSVVDNAANALKMDLSVTTLEATRVSVTQSSKHSAESTLSNSEEVEPSKQKKVTEHSKAVQAKWHAQK